MNLPRLCLWLYNEMILGHIPGLRELSSFFAGCVKLREIWWGLEARWERRQQLSEPLLSCKARCRCAKPRSEAAQLGLSQLTVFMGCFVKGNCSLGSRQRNCTTNKAESPGGCALGSRSCVQGQFCADAALRGETQVLLRCGCSTA